MKKKRNKKRIVKVCNVFLGIFVVVAICLIILLGYLAIKEFVLKPDSEKTSVSVSEKQTKREEKQESERTGQNETEKEMSTKAILGESGQVSDDYFDNTIFLGDSRTVALTAYGYLNEKNTFAENGISHTTFMTNNWSDPVSNTYGDIFEIVAARAPERIYVALGVNGVGFMDKDKFLTTYEEMIARLSENAPDSIIVIESILPVGSVVSSDNENLSNELIDEINQELCNLADKYNASYLNVAEVLKDSEGQMSEEYDNGDGLHYNEGGCQKIYDYICTHGAYKN